MLDGGNDGYRQRLAQVERIIGELNALKVMHYEPMADKGGEMYGKAKEIIEPFIKEIRDNFC